MAAELEVRQFGIGNWLSRETEFDSIKYRLLDTPGSGLSAWARTTSGVVALLLFLQFTTGILLAFHYVPAIGSAYTTVAFIELVVSDGAWIRSLHYHSSVLLPVALAAHLLQLIVRNVYRTNRTAWCFGLVMLVLVLGAGATGYALPWDARAVNGVNIAASLAGNTPLAGESIRTWLINGSAISTLTLSRFYGLHVWIVPMLILMSVVARLFIFRARTSDQDRDQLSAWARQQFARNAIVVGLVFIVISIFSRVYPAPFGPQLTESATYLPRPGPQFLWLFEMQKYTDGPLAAMLAMGLPALVIGGLIALPLFIKSSVGLLRIAVSALFIIGFGTVGVLTAVAVYQDKSDSRVSEQLAKQDRDEAEYRARSFEPQVQNMGRQIRSTDSAPAESNAAPVQVASNSLVSIPASYTVNCAKCHGANGEGKAKNPELVGITTRDEDQLTPEMVLGIINDPPALGRSSKMPSYKDKLSDTDKQEIVSWIRSLSPDSNGANGPLVQTAMVEKKK